MLLDQHQPFHDLDDIAYGMGMAHIDIRQVGTSPE